MVGSTIAWYSLFLFSSGAIYISGAFLPPGSGTSSVTATLGVFAISFLVRPFGALVLGHYGDTRGRKRMLLLTVILCSVSSATIGILPGYAQIGDVAIIPVVAAYLVLGFGVGGEWGGAILLTMENASENDRATRSAYAQATVGIGLLMGSVAYFLLGSILPSAQMASYGWRIPFILSLPLGAIGFAVRMRISETNLFSKVKEHGREEKLPVAEILRRHKRSLILGTLVVGSSGTIFYVGATLLPVVFELEKIVPVESAQVGIALLSLSEIVAVFVGGVASDRLGRRPMIWLANAGLLALIYPAFYFQSAAGLFVSMILFGFVHGIGFAPAGAMISEIYPTSVRSSGNSLTYQLGNSLISGPAPFISALTGSFAFLLYPLYAICWAIIAIAAVSQVPETKDTALA